MTFLSVNGTLGSYVLKPKLAEPDARPYRLRRVSPMAVEKMWMVQLGLGLRFRSCLRVP